MKSPAKTLYFLAILLFFILASCAKTYEIKDVPVYPDAKNVQYSEPKPYNGGQVYEITYSTDDNPKDIFIFYKEKMTAFGWQFTGLSSDSELPNEWNSYMYNHCPFYYIYIRTHETEISKTEVKIEMSWEYCR